MSNRRVVITGMGAISPIGNTTDEVWSSVIAGKCGIDEITLYDTTEQKVKIAGEVKNFVPEDYIDKKEVRRLDRSSQFAVAAAKQAVAMSGIDIEKEDTYRLGVLMASGIGGLKSIQNECLKGDEKGYDRVSPFFIPMSIANMPAGNVAIAVGFKGMCSCPVTACASATNAIGDAMRYVRDGYADVMLCGGTEASITPLGIGGFTSLKALSDSNDKNAASTPFDANRSGFVMGEGAGVFILEEYERAKLRGATIYGEIVGYGVSCDAYHITAPTPDGSGAAKAMEFAMQDGNVMPQQIGYINAHGTSTPLNDAGETKAVKLAFGDNAYNLAISSTKAMTGHLLGASGAVESIITVLALKNNYLPATINYKTKDPECDLDIVPNVGRNANISYAMKNSLGFGGHNASLVFKKWEM